MSIPVRSRRFAHRISGCLAASVPVARRGGQYASNRCLTPVDNRAIIRVLHSVENLWITRDDCGKAVHTAGLPVDEDGSTGIRMIPRSHGSPQPFHKSHACSSQTLTGISRVIHTFHSG